MLKELKSSKRGFKYDKTVNATEDGFDISMKLRKERFER